MIFFWDRKEIYRGVSVEKFNEIRKVLRAQNIKFVTKTRESSEETKIGTDGKSRSFSTIYEIYVQKKDYKRVIQHIR